MKAAGRMRVHVNAVRIHRRIDAARRFSATAGSVMFLLHLGEILEEWTRKQKVRGRSCLRHESCNVDSVWLQTKTPRARC